METLTIAIGWEYFLGIVFGLILVAWYSNGRFTKLETSMEWLREALGVMKNDISGVKKDVNDLKGDVHGLKKDVSGLKLTSDNLKEDISILKLTSDNKGLGAFAVHSPIALTLRGKEILKESGLKEYIDSNKESLMVLCESQKDTNPYEIQRRVFKYFNDIVLEPELEDRIKRFAFNNGMSIEIIKRTGAIYFRDICLSGLGMDKSDIDKHDPNVQAEADV